jgi:pyruvate kinase
MNNKKTKIVCTIGPSSWDPFTLKNLARNGMDVARLNFSHGTHDEKKEQIQLIRNIAQEIGRPIAIMADLQGPKMRLGEIEGVRNIRKGEALGLSIHPSLDELPIQFDISPFVKKGQRIYLNDGLIELTIKDVVDKTILASALNSGWVSSHKGLNIPDTDLKGASFTPKDQADLEFALEQEVDFVCLSFIQSVKDLETPKRLISKSNREIGQHTVGVKTIVKIEKNEAILNLEEIIKASDAIMVARGDLAIETEASQVPIMQQKIIRLCRQYQKPVIVATQMLESLTENPRPTRAETSDVANAVLDQVDAVMLSAESANGKYPIEAVKTMDSVIKSVEAHLDYKNYIKIDWEHINKQDLEFNAIVSSAASIAYRIKAKMIAVATATGRTARLLSSFRPDAQIVAVPHDELVANQLNLVWGVSCIVVKPTKSRDLFWEHVTKSLKESGMVKSGDKIVVVSGSTVGQTGGTDDIKIISL